MTSVLEWLAFSGSLLSVWMYGRHPVRGPLIGMVVAVLFIAFGVVSGVYAAAASNIVFLWLHYRNWVKGKVMDWSKIKRQIAEAEIEASEQELRQMSAINKIGTRAISAIERLTGSLGPSYSSALFDGHDALFDTQMQFATAYDDLKADISMYRRRKFALENPERVVRWDGEDPVLTDDDEAYLLLKHTGYEQKARED